MLGAFNELVEQRTREAMRNEEFHGLPPQGLPLPPQAAGLRLGSQATLARRRRLLERSRS